MLQHRLLGERTAPAWYTGSRTAIRIIVAIWVVLACAATLAEAQTLEVYSLRARSAEELLPIAERILGSDGKAVVDRATNAIVLSGSAEAVARAVETLSLLDQPRQNVRIRWKRVDMADLEARDFELRWRVRAGALRVGSLYRRGVAVSLTLQFEELAQRLAGNASGEVRVIDGEFARISMGASIPVTTRSRVSGRFGSVIRETTRLASAESGLEARPRVLGDGNIELLLRPFQSDLRADGSVRTSELETRVQVRPGEMVAIGELEESVAVRSGDGLTSRGQVEVERRQVFFIAAELP